jgi:hypothetical protein
VPLALQVPLWQGWPQPSSAPQALPLQSPTHWQVPATQPSEPLHCASDVQHAWLAPPQGWQKSAVQLFPLAQEDPVQQGCMSWPQDTHVLLEQT